MNRSLLFVLTFAVSLSVVSAARGERVEVGAPGVFETVRNDTVWYRRVEPGKMHPSCSLRIIRPGKPDETIAIPPTCDVFAARTVFGRTLQVYHFAAVTFTRVAYRPDSTYTVYDEPRRTIASVKYVKGIRIEHYDANGRVRDWTPIDWLPKLPKPTKYDATPTKPDTTPVAADTTDHKK